MSLIHASFWKMKLKADTFDELRHSIAEYNPQSVNISIKPHKKHNHKNEFIQFNLKGPFLNIDKELRVLQKKFKNI